tara:strand:+ start:336 stop:557 length:222 start_codon:yes stop_codon:yes gene_type:complete
MGFLKPKVVMPPPPPDPQPVPEAPMVDDVENIEASEEERERLRKKKGRQATILTSMLGDTTEAELNQPSLLGG